MAEVREGQRPDPRLPELPDIGGIGQLGAGTAPREMAAGHHQSDDVPAARKPGPDRQTLVSLAPLNATPQRQRLTDNCSMNARHPGVVVNWAMR